MSEVLVMTERSGTLPRLKAKSLRPAAFFSDAHLVDILQSVVKATRELAEEPDFEAGIHRWLQTLGENTDAARASIYDTIGVLGGLDQTLRALAEWVRPGVEHSISCSFAEPLAMPVDYASQLWTAIVSSKPFAGTLANTDPNMRAMLEAQGNKAVLCVPFLVAGRTWVVAFDFLVEREFDERTLATLQTAANSIATEIQRRDAEATKLAAEREQLKVAEASAQMLARKRDLLEAVVATADKLLAAPSLDAAADWTCAQLGKALGADRFAIGYMLPPDKQGELGYLYYAYEWNAPGIPRQIDDPALQKLDVSLYLDFYKQLLDRQPIAVLTTEIDDHRAQQQQSAVDTKSQFVYPIFVDDELWGTIGVDDCHTPRVWDEGEIGTLSLVASAISSTVKRERLTQARIDAERARVEVAEGSARMLARRRDLLETVVATSDKLLAAPNLDAAAEWTCEQIGGALEGDRVLIGRFLPSDAKSKRGHIYWAHEWAAPGIALQTKDPELQTIDMMRYVDFHDSLLRGEPLALITNDMGSSQGQSEQESLGVQSLFAYPIFVNGTLWGLLDVDDCCKPRVWDESEIATLSLVASAIASTVERERLTQARIDAERTLSEDRTRIAREIHDTLAQGFTGVIMQTQAAEEALNKSDEPAVVNHLERARAIAGSSLRDARRSVFALLPSVLHGCTLASALRQQLETLNAGGAMLVFFKESGSAGAPSNLIASEFIRIAQEATTNALRHSRAKSIRVTLDWDKDMVTLKVSDDGIGFNSSLDQAGFGLVSIKERASRMGAELSIDTGPDQGTRIIVTAFAGQSLISGKRR
jgi:signal transduction histidine kinase